MANTKISNLPAAASLTGSDLMPVVQSGVTKKGTFDQIPFLQAGTGAVARTAQAKMRDVVSVKDFGAVGDGVADDTAAIQSAIDSVMATGGGTVYIPSGAYNIGTTLNLNDFADNAPANIPINFVKRLRIVGNGSGSTRLLGGEAGYGFFEFIGANYIHFQGFSIVANRASNYPQFGLLGGRKTGNPSSGSHTFEDVFVLGKFTKTAHFMLSSETNNFSNCCYYPQIGNGCVMAMNNLPWGITPKYGTLGSGLGGNGDNQFENCFFLSANEASIGEVVLALEYAQDFRLTSCYFATSIQASHVFLRKSASGTIENCFFEKYGSFDPYSVYFAPDDGTDPNDYIDYRDIKITGCRLLRVFGDTGAKVTNMTIENSVFRGNAAGTTYHIDIDKVYDSRFENSNLLPNVTGVTDVKLRIRSEGYNNYYRGFTLGSVIGPTLFADTFQLTASDSVAFSDPTQGGINTIPGAAVNYSGATATIVAGSVPTAAAFALMLDFVCPSAIDGNARMLCGIGGSTTNLGGTNTISVYIFNGRLFFRSFGPTSAGESTYGTVDTNFVQKFAGQRMKMLVVRSGAIPIVYINGYLVSLSVVTEVGGRTWAGDVTANVLMIGFQGFATTSNASTIYYSAALFNYAPAYAKARQLTTIGLIGTDQWGSAFGGGTNGCVGFWDFESGGGVSVFDQGPFAQHATISGTVSRLQNSVKKVHYRTNPGSPSGVLTPAFIGEDVLNTTGGQWFKATGLTNTSWAQLN